MRNKKAILLLLVIYILTMFSSACVVFAADESNPYVVENDKVLLHLIGEAVSNFESELHVRTTFELEYYKLTIDTITEYAKKYDPYTGNLIYKLRYETNPIGNGQYDMNFKFAYYITEEEYTKLNKFADKFVADMGDMSDYEKVKYTHDYLVENNSYNINMDGPYNCIFNKQSNCNGYALAFCLIMNKCNIPCTYITGNMHGWNAVKLGSFWYNIDVTWDDTNNKLSYNYFLCGRSDWKGHASTEATAAYKYDEYRGEWYVWITTIFYWIKWPILAFIVLFIIKKIFFS